MRLSADWKDVKNTNSGVIELSKSTELWNITHRNQSGNAFMYGEENVEYFDTIGRKDSTEFVADIEEGAERRNQVLYIKGYFAILEQILDSEEFRFIKCRYKKNLPDHIIAGWIGIVNPLVRISQKVLKNKEKFVQLKKEYPWDGAETFERVLLKKFSDIIQNPEKEGAVTLDKKTAEKLKLAKMTKEERKQHYLEFNEARRPYRNEYMRGYAAAMRISGRGLIIKSCEKIEALLPVLSVLSVMKKKNGKKTEVEKLDIYTVEFLKREIERAVNKIKDNLSLEKRRKSPREYELALNGRNAKKAFDIK